MWWFGRGRGHRARVRTEYELDVTRHNGIPRVSFDEYTKRGVADAFCDRQRTHFLRYFSFGWFGRDSRRSRIPQYKKESIRSTPHEERDSPREPPDVFTVSCRRSLVRYPIALRGRCMCVHQTLLATSRVCTDCDRGRGGSEDTECSTIKLAPPSGTRMPLSLRMSSSSGKGGEGDGGGGEGGGGSLTGDAAAAV